MVNKREMGEVYKLKTQEDDVMCKARTDCTCFYRFYNRWLVCWTMSLCCGSVDNLHLERIASLLDTVLLSTCDVTSASYRRSRLLLLIRHTRLQITTMVVAGVLIGGVPDNESGFHTQALC